MSQQVVNLDSLMNQFPGYDNSYRVKTDLINLAKAVKTLIPGAGKLIQNDGNESRMLVIGGTVPILFQNAHYHIPVEIFIPPSYPSNPPICYVRPTPSMSIKTPHRHVDVEGLIYLPYLHSWNPRTHTLTDLVAYIAQVFGQDPPVFARSQQQAGLMGYMTQAFGQDPHVFARSQQQTPSRSPQVSAQPPSYSEFVAQRKDPVEEARKTLTNKVQQSLKEFYSQLQEEIEQEFVIQRELASEQSVLAKNLASLDLKKTQIQEQTEVAKKKIEQVEMWHIENSFKDDAGNPQDLVQAANVWSQQLLQSEAEIHAIDDTLYYLELGLKEKKVTLSVFLQEVRKLSRKQFMCKALIKKIQHEQRQLL